jgi:hypothetical protein
MQLRPDELKRMFDLRDDLDGEDRALMRRAIKYIEYLEQRVRELRRLLSKEQSNGV